MKTTKAILIGALCILLPLVGHASLISTVNTDTLTDLDIDWSWDPEVVSTDIPGSLNWNVLLSANANPFNGNWEVRLEVQHKAIPHATETVPPITYKAYSFSNASDFGIVINDTFDVSHPGEGHIDSYTFVLDRSPTPSATTWSLQGTHQIPEPNSIVLIGISCGLIGCVRRLGFSL